ncbi:MULTISPECIES: geranylgeranyl reductase family protein [unclassified Dietzia]|uniref:geranylgeranyl reductase family protein n=1 Tax=unclassified Dietzia TaxID=2617939 RepID=UPI000D213D3B|nr:MULTISPECIES: geranylgeranyl reductase family protein [unclassified Dietzia]AVZ40145.1 FAD-linked oxidoreductase [Dietzia sp. JS16-p6b]
MERMDPRPRPPASTDVLVVGCGPAGSATATWLARAGREVTVLDAAAFPRDKTCGDGLTPRAMGEVDRLGLGGWARDRITIRGLELRGFGHERRVPWPDGDHGGVASAVRRTVFDDRLRAVAVEAGSTVLDGVRVTGVEKGDDGEVVAVRAGADRIACRTLVLADGVRSPVGRMLGRTWHRDTVYAVAARSYVRSARHDHPWIGSDLELRDEAGTIQPGYGWVFPLGDGEVNLGVGALATATRPANVAVRDLLLHYARSVRRSWALEGDPHAVTSALLPMGGAVSGLAGPNWAAVGDAAACVNPLNGEGIDYALEGGRLLADLVTAGGAGGDLTRAWPEVLRRNYGEAFAIARDAARLLTYPRFLPLAGPVGMRSQTLMSAAVRCMSNTVAESDRDLVARAWRAAGSVARRLDRRPLFAD